MEKNCVSLETAKKLKAVGFPQNHTYAYWVFDTFVGKWLLLDHIAAMAEDFDETLAAPTAQEIADELPPFVYDKTKNGYKKNRYLVLSRTGKGYTARYEANGGSGVYPSMAEAVAAPYLN